MHDSHIHLARNPLRDNWKRDTQDFINMNGKKILTQGSDVEDFNDTFQVAHKINQKFGDIVDIALGIHPTIFQENFCKDNCDNIFNGSKKLLTRFVEIFEQEKDKLSAVGETGLDYFEMYNTKVDGELIETLKQVQKESFRVHIKLAKENNLPLSIHARELPDKTDCINDVLELVAKNGKGLVNGSFHSYTGELSLVSDILDLGFCIGFNAIITYPNGENVREILKKVPNDRILFETDGPFLAVQSIRKDKKALIRYGRSAQIKEIIEIAAEIKNMPAQKLEDISDENYERVFG
ncbi:TatD family hydrolase [bacterium]|nr:TatD family hydrolase [bacterium]